MVLLGYSYNVHRTWRGPRGHLSRNIIALHQELPMIISFIVRPCHSAMEESVRLS